MELYLVRRNKVRLRKGMTGLNRLRIWRGGLSSGCGRPRTSTDMPSSCKAINAIRISFHASELDARVIKSSVSIV